MTSIEYLEKKLKGDEIFSLETILSNAKEMHKQEIIKANRDGVDMAVDKKPFITGEQYYQETFVSKESNTLKDYHIVDTNEMVELSQQDIDKFEKFLDNEIAFGLSPKDRIERIKWYYQTYFKSKKTLYTEEQVREVIEKAKLLDYNNKFVFTTDHLIQSLKQPKQ